jgi:hypothetical protein
MRNVFGLRETPTSLPLPAASATSRSPSSGSSLLTSLALPQIGDFIVAIRDSDPQSTPDYSALHFLLRDMASAARSSASPPVTEKPATQRSQKKSAAAPRSAAPEPEPVVSAVATPIPATRPKRKAASQTAKVTLRPRLLTLTHRLATSGDPTEYFVEETPQSGQGTLLGAASLSPDPDL